MRGGFLRSLLPLRPVPCTIVLALSCGGEPRPHIVLITADALRADHLSVAGYPRQTSPEIDAFASRATLYTHAATVIPKTGPAFASIFTGLHPEEHGVRVNYARLPEDAATLAEVLSEAGYRTAAFVANPVLRESVGFHRGFEEYYVLADQGATATLAREVPLWIARGGWDRPTFLWVHFLDPHGPYTPPPELLEPFLADSLTGSGERVPLSSASEGESGDKVLGAIPAYQIIEGEDRVDRYVARYDAEILHVDGAFRKILAALEESGQLEESAVVFTSDHGESLGEHDYYFEHGWNAHEPSLRIPLIIKLPGQRDGRREDELVSILDLRPTLLAIAGLERPARGATPGVSLLGGVPLRGPLAVENSDGYPDKYFGLHYDGWKYLVRTEDRGEELFDVRADPGELRNLALQRVDLLEGFRGIMRGWIESLKRTTAERAEDDEATLRALRELGY